MKIAVGTLFLTGVLFCGYVRISRGANPAAVAMDGSIKVFEKTGINSIVCSPDSKLLATAGDGGIVKLWDTHTGELVRPLICPKTNVKSVAFSPDGTLLASGGDDRKVRLWNVHTGQLIKTISGYGNPVHSVLFSPDGKTLFSASWDGILMITPVMIPAAAPAEIK